VIFGRNRSLAILIAICVIFLSVSGLPIAQATSSTVPTGSIGLYMDEPFVQASYANSPSFATETFDSIQVDPASNTKLCESTNPIQVGDLLPTCTIHGPDSAASEAFSASTSLSDPSVGGSKSGFLTSHPGQGYSVTFSERKKYVGFWWATASAGNTVKFYSNESLVAEISIDGVNSLIGTAPADDSSYAADTSTVTSIGGTDYFKKYYFGNPRHYPVGSLTPPQAVVGSEAFVYLHAFAGDGVGFNRVEFTTSSSGFEIDNLTTSSESINIDQRLVLVGTVATQGTYEGLAASSGSGSDWINLKGTQLGRTANSAAGYQTVYWLGRDTNGNWSGPTDLEASGGTVRNHSSDSSIDVLLPVNSFTHIIFWIDWCADLVSGPCFALHFGNTDINSQDLNYRYRKTRNFTYLTTGSGTIQGNSQQTVTFGSDGSAVTAIPASGGQFIRWSDDLSDPPTIPATRNEVSLTEDTVLTAEFTVVTTPTTTPTPSSPSSDPGQQTALPQPETISQTFELSGFTFENAAVNKAVKVKLAMVMNSIAPKYSGMITCQGQTGFNWNKRSEKYLKSVANKRAKNVCKILKSKFPRAQVKILEALKSDSKLPDARKVKIVTLSK
jgi:hypothetical protein